MEHDATGQAAGAANPGTRRPKGRPVCKFYQSPGGCRAGGSCQYVHVSEQPAPVTPGPSSRIVQRPVPRAQQEDPRGFQLDQIRRRFTPKEETKDDGETVLTFKLAPSDPDFPFEISALDCILRVPAHYGATATGMKLTPKLRVTNSEMGRGYQINVEKGFDDIVEKSPRSTLLQLMNALDRDLEKLLAAPKAETIKIVPNRQKPEERRSELKALEHGAAHGVQSPAGPKMFGGTFVPVYSIEELQKAKAKRAADTRQLEARMSRLPLYFKSLDGMGYTLPIEPRRRAELPLDMRAMKTIRLIVPELYPLIHCRVEFPGLNGDHLPPIQKNFEKSVTESPETSLFAHVNRLTQNIHLMLERTEPETEVAILVEAEPTPIAEKQPKISSMIDDDKSHIIVIPRPPEWDIEGDGESEDDGFEFGEFTSDEHTGEDEDEVEQEAHKLITASGPERGIMMSFPHLELHSIELLELLSLSLTVKCSRCKDQTDVNAINNSAEDPSAVKMFSCRKCANKLSVGFRMDLMHAHCVRAGYLDMEGCTVVDMLPSYFLPSCSECSTPVTSPGVVSVRGESTMAICRECHKRLSFRIPEIRFLRVSTATMKATEGAAPRRKQKENLGIKAGEHLPNRGRCKHYSKSFRWFRFSCCNKVFACDKCHDLDSDHPNEHANRMICGHCSREQIYRPENCGICRASLVARKGTGFWEGGQGTRDRVKMSRKDPRKYKRKGPAAGAAAKK